MVLMLKMIFRLQLTCIYILLGPGTIARYYCDFGYCKCNIVIVVVVVAVVIVPYDD